MNNDTVSLSGLQSRCELSVNDGAGDEAASLAFVQAVVPLRRLLISEETLRDLWHIETKLLEASPP